MKSQFREQRENRPEAYLPFTASGLWKPASTQMGKKERRKKSLRVYILYSTLFVFFFLRDIIDGLAQRQGC